MSALQAGLTLSIALALGPLSATVTGRLADRIEVRPLILLGLLMIATCLTAAAGAMWLNRFAILLPVLVLFTVWPPLLF
ncbi:MAG: hypothetical protein GTO41_22045, partial [Burkholderiales bacterium]|nr:hypothetical protein [Burkholderiales bacterium]